jgi:hypothetical protein
MPVTWQSPDKTAGNVYKKNKYTTSGKECVPQTLNNVQWINYCHKYLITRIQTEIFTATVHDLHIQNTYISTTDFDYYFFFLPQAALYSNLIWWICQIKQMINIINISTLYNFFFQSHCSWHYTGYVKYVKQTNKQTNTNSLIFFSWPKLLL